MARCKRIEQFDPSEICIVHAIQRCVRRAFLAGVDEKSGKDFSFRKDWICRRMEALASVFAIDVFVYSVMSNHVHLVVRNRPDVVEKWSNNEVALRWLRIFPGRRIDEQLAEPTQEDVAQLAQNADRLREIRKRLSDLSWFMRALAEPIARMANRQDECTGRFWEGRFKAQRIVDDAGLLACAMYVDLNPVRAALAATVDLAKHTSAYDRIRAAEGETIASAAYDLVTIEREDAAKKIRSKPIARRKRKIHGKCKLQSVRRILRDGWLSPLFLEAHSSSQDPQLHHHGLRASDKGFLNMSWSDYRDLLDWTGQQRKPTSTEAIPTALHQMLAQLGIDGTMWRDLVWNFKKYFGRSTCAGRPDSMAASAKKFGKRYHHGQRQAKACFI